MSTSSPGQHTFAGFHATLPTYNGVRPLENNFLAYFQKSKVVAGEGSDAIKLRSYTREERIRLTVYVLGFACCKQLSGNSVESTSQTQPCKVTISGRAQFFLISKIQMFSKTASSLFKIHLVSVKFFTFPFA